MSAIVISELKERELPEGFSMGALTFVLAALSWIGPFSIDTYLPSLPHISQELSASAVEVQQTMTAFMLSFAVMSLWHGAISDAYGRRRITLIALSVYSLASVSCALSADVHMLMAFRAIQGATAGVGAVVGRAVVRDLFEGAAAQRLMSYVATIFTIAPVMAPLAGGYLEVNFGWRSVFYFLVILSAFLVLCSWRALPETLPHNQRQRLQPLFLAVSYWKVLTCIPYLMVCASMSFVGAGLFIYIVGAPTFLMQHLKLSETEFLWLFLPISIAMVIGAWISGRCAGKFTGRQTILGGYVIMAVAAVGNVLLNVWMPPVIPWTIVPIFFYVTGMAMAMPSLTLIILDLFPMQRGLASSCLNFINIGFNSFVSAFVAFVWGSTLSFAVTELVMLGAGVAAILLHLWAVKHFEAAKAAVT
jgi:DHA1 family bicyclomycin/chloramphenicol resistance-like MFS transporter